jgi:UDP-N-acetylglucosamine 2-epimerase (non-hydrolysing)
MKIGIIIGTRPEAIKLIPLFLELKNRNANVQLVLTGQHKEMVDQIMYFFSVSADHNMEVMKPNQQLAELTASLLIALDKLFRKERYDAVMVQGDTTTAMTAAIAAFYLQIPVGHVEAGLRTYNLASPFPEEMNRQVITRLSRWNFAPTLKAASNLEAEGTKHIFTVGNTVIDSLLLCNSIIEKNKEVYVQKFAFLFTYKKIILVTGHRRENFSKETYSILEAIKVLAETHPESVFYYPVHLNPKVQQPVNEILGNHQNIILDQPLNYDELIFVMKHSYIIMTDSGGIQEEAPTFGIPIIVLRDTTERPEGIENGCAVLAGTNKKDIISAFNLLNSDTDIYARMSHAGNPYGDGTTSKKITDILLNNQ